jgi:hypothetical protein
MVDLRRVPSFDKATRARKLQARHHHRVRAASRPAGLRMVAELLEQAPAELRNVRALDVMSWPRRMGLVSARSLWLGLAAPPWSEDKRCGELTRRQALLLAERLRALAEHADSRVA